MESGDLNRAFNAKIKVFQITKYQFSRRFNVACLYLNRECVKRDFDRKG